MNQAKRDRKLNHLFGIIDRATKELTQAAEDVRLLRTSMESWSALVEPLTPISRAALLQRWYIDHLLAGCRRLLDPGNDVISIKRALTRLQHEANEITDDVLVEYRRARGIVPRAAEESGTESVAAQLEEHLEEIERLGADIAVHATRTVAHRSVQRIPSVEIHQVEALLQRLGEIHAYWSTVLRGEDWALDTYGVGDLQQVALAVQLFDYQAFTGAEMEAIGAAGRDASSDDVRARARLSYHFDAPEESHKAPPEDETP